MLQKDASASHFAINLYTVPTPVPPEPAIAYTPEKCTQDASRKAHQLLSYVTLKVHPAVPTMPEILNHKLRIKAWEREFAAKHGRIPSKADVKADVEIWKAYKSYNEMKKASKSSKHTASSKNCIAGTLILKEDLGVKSTMSEEPQRARLSSLPQPRMFDKNTSSQQDLQRELRRDSPFLSSINVSLTDDEEFESVVPVQNAELGPTPQANGKVLSIFDLILSPPESSPIKKLTQKQDLRLPHSIPHSTSPFKTPTKPARRMHYNDLTPSRGLSVTEKLRMALSPQKLAETPKLLEKTDVIETPRYIGKVNSKFAFNDLHSPLQASPSKQRIFQTPTKPSVELFQDSPSPLKSQRLLLSRLSDMFNAQQKLASNEEYEAQRREFEKEFEIVEEAPQELAPTLENVKDMRKRKKATTQKRTTRRWKIKPRVDGEEGAAFEGKDVHEEMQRLEAQDRLDLIQYIEGEASAEETSEDEDEVIVRKKPASTKINPVSNNFQRLKINDPRAKKFKQRMKRR